MSLLNEISGSPLGFGGGAVSGEGGGYGFGDISVSDSVSLLRYAYEMGYHIFDSAPIYGFGTSEERIGLAFKDIREQVFLVSKSGIDWHDNKRVNRTNDPKVAEKMLEQSLRRFNSDYIDLYLVHWPDEHIDIRRTIEFFSKAKSQGKIKHIGLCNTTPEDLSRAREVDSIEVVQSQFNLFERGPLELFPDFEENKVSFMSWGTLDKGILTGRVDKKREQSKDYTESDCRKRAPWWSSERVYQKLERLEPVWKLLEERGHTPLEMAIGHNLAYSGCSTALVGPKTHKQVEETVEALSNLPSKELIEEIVQLVHG